MADNKFIQYGQGPKEAMPKHGDKYIGMIYYATDTHETFLYTDTEIVKQTVGAKTAEGGEIFNNYDNNKALSANSHASGTNTQAGGRGFQAISCEVGEDGNSLVYSFSNNETTTQALTLLQLEIASVAEATIDITVIPTESKANPTRSWGNLDYCGKIISVDPSKAQIITTMDSYIAGDKRPWASETQPATVIVPAYSHIGTIIVGNGANATGWSSKAVNAVANASGYNTLAAGKYSNAMNLKTVAGGYAATAGGWETKALGQGSFTHGKWNTVLPNAEFSAAFGEGNEVKWAHNFVVGKYADNTNPRYFVVGGGTDANNRKNLMEIGEKTAIVNVFNSNQSNSIVPKWYLDAWTIKKKAYSGQSNPTWATIEEVNKDNLQSIINLDYLNNNFYNKQTIDETTNTLHEEINAKADKDDLPEQIYTSIVKVGKYKRDDGTFAPRKILVYCYNLKPNTEYFLNLWTRNKQDGKNAKAWRKAEHTEHLRCNLGYAALYENMVLKDEDGNKSYVLPAVGQEEGQINWMPKNGVPQLEWRFTTEEKETFYIVDIDIETWIKDLLKPTIKNNMDKNDGHLISYEIDQTKWEMIGGRHNAREFQFKINNFECNNTLSIGKVSYIPASTTTEEELKIGYTSIN